MNGQGFGDYRPVHRLAEGGMGEVFLARLEREEGFSKLVVLKILRPELAGSERVQKWFAAEARLTAALAHPNIVQVLDFGKKGSQFFLVMEYVDGADLGRVLALAKAKLLRPQLEFILAVGLSLSRALQFAHRRTPSLVHGDVNPHNVLLGRQGEIKLGDFGLAALSISPEEGHTLAAGKLGYMSPETAAGKPPAPAADIFSLGAVLYHLACGEPPFAPAGSLAEGLARCRRYQIRPLESWDVAIHPGLRAIIERCLRAEPHQRFADAAQVEDALFRLAAAVGADSGPRQVAGFLEKTLCGECSAFEAAESRGPAVSATVVAKVSAAKNRKRFSLIVWIALAGVLAGAGALLYFSLNPRQRQILPQEQFSPPPAPPPIKAPAPSATETEAPMETAQEHTVPARRKKPVEKTVVVSEIAENNPSEDNEANNPAPKAAAADYLFALRPLGGAVLSVDGKEVGPEGYLGREPLAQAMVARVSGAQGLQAVFRLEPEAGERGLLLAVQSKPFAIFSLDGRPRGLTPLAQITLSPGRHQLSLAAKSGAELSLLLEFK